MADIACGSCGSKVPAGQAVWGGIRATPGGGRERVDPYCSTPCQVAGQGRVRRMASCANPGCQERFTPAAGPGRPQVFHDDRCRRAAGRLLNRALRDLARNKMPRTGDARRRLEELERARFELECLVRSWQHPTVARAQSGRVPMPPPEAAPVASPEVAAAAQRRLADLAAAITDARAYLVTQSQAQLEQEAAESRDAHLRARQQADLAWREKLVGFIPAVEGEE